MSVGGHEPIRILRVIGRMNVGGPALHVSYLTSELDRIGYQTILVAGRVGPGEGSMEHVAEEVGVEPLAVPELQRDISALVDSAAVRRLRRLIREFRPHILHTHTAKAGAVGRTAALVSGSARPPVIVHTYHGHVLRGYFGRAHSQAFLRVEQLLARVSDALVAVSPEVRDDLVALGVAPADRFTVIRLGLDLERRVAASPTARADVRAELGLDPDAFVVAWIGRMTEIKRPDDLLAAFAELRVRRPEAALVLVGDGPLKPDLEQRVAELGILADTRFAGFRDDVGALYAAADAVALTSANEGTPVSLIEALAARRPVVATDVGGVSDVVTDGRSGFLVPAGDVESIADRLVRLADDVELRSALGAAGREDVFARYSVPRLVSEIDALYRRLLEQRDVPRPLARALPPAAPAPPSARRLRVVLVSQYFPPEIGATQSRMQSFAEHLADRGHDVTVICEFPNHPHGVFPPEYRGRVLEDDRSNPYRILRVWVKADPRKTQRTRMAFYLSFMGLATAVAPLAGRPDVVVATTPPLFTGLAGLAIARMSGAPLVLDVRDLWPAAATSLRQISSGWETDVAEAIERRLYRSASRVVAVTAPFCRHIDALRHGRSPTVLIPNGTLEQFLNGHSGAGDRSDTAPGRFLVTFAGTLGIAQALPSVLDAASRVDDVADFVFVGDGPMREATVAEARERDLANVRFRPQLPIEEMPPILAGSDALLVPLSGHPTFEQFVPSKLVDFMASARPVLLAAAGESARILEHARAGIVVPPEDPVALADAVRWLAAHPEEAEAMGARGREFAVRRLRSVQAERLEQLLLDVAGG